jgi:head-tail adaptor
MLTGTLRWLGQTVTIAPLSTANAYGESTYGSAVTVDARVEQNDKQTLDAQGNMVISTSQVTVDGDTAVAATSRITLPDATTPKIIAVKKLIGPDGTAYAKVIYT